MHRIKNFLFLFLTKKFFKKLAAYLLLIIIFYLLKDFLGIFFLIFIFAYLFHSAGEFLKKKFDHFIKKFCKVKKRREILEKIFSFNLIIVFLYLGFIGMIIFILSDLLPQLTKELSDLSQTIPYITDYINDITTKLDEIRKLNTELGGTIVEIVESKDYQVIIDVLKQLKTAGSYLLDFVLALILSFVFIIDRKKLGEYLLGIKKSSFGFLHKEYSIILDKIVLSFGLIFKAQAMIAFANAFLTIIGLTIIGFMHGEIFPFLLTLGLIVFISGFIPVLGVFLSSIPILVIAFTHFGGYSVIVEIVLLIFIVHMIEAYYLNPKIVSKFLEIPVSLTFMILIISEHIFGIAGLLIGISLFYFIVGLLRDFDKNMKKKTRLFSKNKILNK